MEGLAFMEGLSGNRILEVAIGLVFVFLLVSLLVAWIQEGIASVLKWRAEHMIEVIQVLLQPSSADTEASKTYDMKNLLTKIKEAPRLQDSQLLDPKGEGVDPLTIFYGSPLIKSLSKPNQFPSYIDPRDFADYVLDYILQADLNKDVPQQSGGKASFIETQLKAIEKTVKLIANEDAKDAIMSKVKLAWNTNDAFETRVAAARNNIIDWFNTTTDRADGWYKRKAQRISLIIGLVVVIALNIDTFGMAWSFYNEAQLRQFVIQEASEAFVFPNECIGKSDLAGCLTNNQFPIPTGCEENKTEEELTTCIIDSQSTALLQQLDDLPIGWSLAVMDTEKYDPNRFPPLTPVGMLYWVLKIFGLLLTAYAVSFGASFWYDLLGKLVNMRLTGKKPKPQKS